MQVWRLCRARHASTAFDGEGARLYGGRWNHKGLPMVYTSATLSLAALEVLVHHRVPIPPFEFVALAADIPARLKIETIRVQDLPTDWQTDPAGRITKHWISLAATRIVIGVGRAFGHYCHGVELPHQSQTSRFCAVENPTRHPIQF